MATLNFDASTVVPATGAQDPIPAGWYNAAITASEMKPTKDGTGLRLNLTLTVLDGAFSGRKVFEGLNLKNLNPIAVEIAYKQLSAICHAAGVIQVSDSELLHNIPMKVKVKLVAAAGQYEAKNEPTAYKNINDPSAGQVNTTSPAPGAAVVAPPIAPVVPSAAGWTPPATPQPWAAPAAPGVAPAAPAVAAPAPAPAAAMPAFPAFAEMMPAFAAPAAVVAPAAVEQSATTMPVTPPWATAAV